MEVFAKLGVDWKLLLAQAVNFGVLFFILKHYAYRPMLDFLEQRTLRIEQGLKDAEAAQMKLVEMETKEKDVLVAARNEAKGIVAAAEEAAKNRDALRLAETEAKTKKFLEEAQVKIGEEKERILAEAKQEIAVMVVAGVEKILKEKVDVTTDTVVIKKMTP